MKPFQFKKFSIDQDKCAMKVTLDACLFGGLCAQFIKQATAELNIIPNTALDIGSGTGLLSLILAQAGVKNIVGVELDSAAAAQSKQNIDRSPFKHQVSIVQSDIQSYCPAHKFDLIVSNPPFLTDNLKGPNQKRNQARHNDSLSFSHLAGCISKLLSAQGTAWLLLPCNEFSQFEKAAVDSSLLVRSKHWIQSQQNKDPHRVAFTLQHSTLKILDYFEETVVIKTDSKAEYSPKFKQLLTDYYLKL
jgi:tRNA1Val (adenine37-N6)-methyltransferase